MSKVKVSKEQVMLEELKGVMNDFIETNYGVTLKIPVEWSGRLRVALGYFGYNRSAETTVYKGLVLKEGEVIPGTEKIVLSKQLLRVKKKEIIESIAKHEALHYALFELGKPYQDGEPYFERELKRHGLVSTSVSSDELGMKPELYVWTCSGCKKIIISGGRTRKDYTRYFSECCEKRLENRGWQRIGTTQEYLE